MIKRFKFWLQMLIFEAISDKFFDLETKLTVIQETLVLINENLKQVHSSLDQVHSSPAHDGSGSQESGSQFQTSSSQNSSSPVSTTRPSWPRMKRYLEERDVRNLVQERNNMPEYTEAKRLASQMSEEAERLETYWKHKSARVPENQD